MLDVYGALPINYAFDDAEWLDAPEGARDSDGWLALRAGAVEANRELAREIDDIAFQTALVGVSQDKYRRLVLRVAKYAKTLPVRVDVALNFWRGEEKVCQLKARVEGWKLMEEGAPNAEASRAKAWLESLGAGRVYVGEAPVRWQVCPRNKMQRAKVEVELVGADPRSSRFKLNVGHY